MTPARRRRGAPDRARPARPGGSGRRSRGWDADRAGLLGLDVAARRHVPDDEAALAAALDASTADLAVTTGSTARGPWTTCTACWLGAPRASSSTASPSGPGLAVADGVAVVPPGGAAAGTEVELLPLPR
ncbi:MAG: hypothetical protein ACXV0U_04210 [Kineosporiaceae bacterium]